jgi:hypothetical protein
MRVIASALYSLNERSDTELRGPVPTQHNVIATDTVLGAPCPWLSGVWNGAHPRGWGVKLSTQAHQKIGQNMR